MDRIKLKKNTKLGIKCATVLMVAEAFVRTISWVPVNSLALDSPWRTQAASIARGDQAGSRCTYWVLNETMVMTNGHCLASDTQTTWLLFPDGKRVSCPTVITHEPWEKLDYMVLECEGELPEPLVLDLDHKLKKGDLLAHISWNCDYIGNPHCNVQPMIDLVNDCKVEIPHYLPRKGMDFLQGCDSLGGSSGSPVHLRESMKVIGLHHSGFTYTDDPEKKYGPYNGTVHIGLVAKKLDSLGIKYYSDSSKPSRTMGLVDIINMLIDFILSLISK